MASSIAQRRPDALINSSYLRCTVPSPSDTAGHYSLDSSYCLILSLPFILHSLYHVFIASFCFEPPSLNQNCPDPYSNSGRPSCISISLHKGEQSVPVGTLLFLHVVQIMKPYCLQDSRHRAVGIATGPPRDRSSSTDKVKNIFHVVQTGSGTHSASYAMDIWGCYQGIERPESEAHRLPPTSVGVNKIFIYTSAPQYFFIA
jgi:hypothetical protein